MLLQCPARTHSSRRILKIRYGPILFLIPVMVRFNNWDSFILTETKDVVYMW